MILLLSILTIKIANELSCNKQKIFYFCSLLLQFLILKNGIFLIGFPLIYYIFKLDISENNYYLYNVILLINILSLFYIFPLTCLKYVFYFWGMPILILAYILSKKGEIITRWFCFSLIIISSFTVIYKFKNFNPEIYVINSKNNVVSNYRQLSKYYNNTFLYKSNETVKKNSFIIVPLCEEKCIYNNLKIESNQNYLFLAEHDNLNDCCNNFKIINNDSYFRKSPWTVYKPCMNNMFNYWLKNDDLYSSNIGATLNDGFPLMWDYNHLGVIRMLATVKKVNNSFVYTWGDSDFLVNKLLPYNINFVSALFNKLLDIYPLCLMLLSLIILSLLNGKKEQSVICFLFMIILYFCPQYCKYTSTYKIYSSLKNITAHNFSYPTSIKNSLGSLNCAVKNSSKNDCNIAIIKGSENIKKYKNVKIIFLLPFAKLKCTNSEIQCSDIKIGNENNIIDSRILLINDKLTESNIVDINGIKIIGTNSPQLNARFIREYIYE